jgi:RimJ/RimL family protein N-acetyltransferase
VLELPDKTEVVIKDLTNEDLDRLHAFFCSLPEPERRIAKNDVTNRANVKAWLKSSRLAFVRRLGAEVDGELVSIGALYHPRERWSRHVGEFRLWCLPEWKKRGVAALLARELLILAIQRKLEKVQVLLVAYPGMDMKFWERLGLQKEGVLTKHVKDLKGRKRDLVIMGMRI